MIRKSYVDVSVEGRVSQAHLRRAGRGTPIVMLHPSPMSSAFLQPVIECAGRYLEVFAPDNPGYGRSDPLPEPPDSLAGYTLWLAALLEALGLGQVAVYGSATGAQIAIEFSKAYPERVSAMVLENVAHFEADEVERIMEDYFPDISPRADGAHLATVWSMAEAVFKGFPWYEHLGREAGDSPPLDFVHATAMAYLEAGPDYARAYRAAFKNERADRLAAVPVPVKVVRWSGGLLNEFSQRLDDHPMPDHIEMLHCGPAVEARFAALDAAFSALVPDVQRT